jgi:hypothetical protein
MMVGVIPVNQGSMMLPDQEIMIANNVKLDYYPLNTHRKLGRRSRRVFEDGFSQK